MLVLIVKDGGATKVPREVGGMDDVEKLREQGLEVEVPADPNAADIDAEVKTVTYADGTVVTGHGDLPEQSPAEQDAAAGPVGESA